MKASGIRESCCHDRQERCCDFLNCLQSTTNTYKTLCHKPGISVTSSSIMCSQTGTTGCGNERKGSITQILMWKVNSSTTLAVLYASPSNQREVIGVSRLFRTTLCGPRGEGATGRSTRARTGRACLGGIFARGSTF